MQCSAVKCEYYCPLPGKRCVCLPVARTQWARVQQSGSARASKGARPESGSSVRASGRQTEVQRCVASVGARGGDSTATNQGSEQGPGVGSTGGSSATVHHASVTTAAGEMWRYHGDRDLHGFGLVRKGQQVSVRCRDFPPKGRLYR